MEDEADYDLPTMLAEVEKLLLQRLRRYGFADATESGTPDRKLYLTREAGLLFDGTNVASLSKEDQITTALRLPNLVEELEARHNRDVMETAEAKSTAKKVLDKLRVKT